MFPACENSDTGAGKPSTRRRCRLQPRMVTTVDDPDQDPAGPGLGCHEPGSRRNPVRDCIRSGISRQPDPASPILMPTRLPGRAAPRPFRPASPFPTDKCPDSPDNRPPYPPHTPHLILIPSILKFSHVFAYLFTARHPGFRESGHGSGSCRAVGERAETRAPQSPGIHHLMARPRHIATLPRRRPGARPRIL